MNTFPNVGSSISPSIYIEHSLVVWTSVCLIGRSVAPIARPINEDSGSINREHAELILMVLLLDDCNVFSRFANFKARWRVVLIKHGRLKDETRHQKTGNNLLQRNIIINTDRSDGARLGE